MAKSKTASATLSMLKQMSTERQKDASERKGGNAGTEDQKKQKNTGNESVPQAEAKKESAPEKTAAAEVSASAPVKSTEPAPAAAGANTIDPAAFEALKAENARIQAEKEAAERLAREKEAEARKAAERAREAASASAAAPYGQNPYAAYSYDDSASAVVKPGKTQFRNMVKEKKNIRKNFLLTPSNSEHLKEEAEELGTSMNDLLNLILEDRYN